MWFLYSFHVNHMRASNRSKELVTFVTWVFSKMTVRMCLHGCATLITCFSYNHSLLKSILNENTKIKIVDTLHACMCKYLKKPKREWDKSYWNLYSISLCVHCKNLVFFHTFLQMRMYIEGLRNKTQKETYLNMPYNMAYPMTTLQIGWNLTSNINKMLLGDHGDFSYGKVIWTCNGNLVLEKKKGNGCAS